MGEHGAETAKQERRSKRKGKDQNQNDATDDPSSRPPSDMKEAIVRGLSQLGKTADGLHSAFLNLTVTFTPLSNLDLIAQYSHLQCLNLAHNQLTSISALSNLKYLTSIDVSHNKLTQVLDYVVPPGGANLRVANFTYNRISIIRDLKSDFPRLEELRLDFNRIEYVSGLHSLPLLSTLSLSHNVLKNCNGVTGLSNLRDLNIEANEVASLQPLSVLSGLEVVSAAHNALTSLRGVEGLRQLRKLFVQYNCIPSLEEVAWAASAPLLSLMAMEGNPLEQAMSIRLHMVYLLPQVTVLNGTPVSAKEKVLAANMHGADAEGLRLIRKKHFPNGELDDGGGAIPPTAAGLIASHAEEEAIESLTAPFVRIDAWVHSLVPELLIAAASHANGRVSMSGLGASASSAKLFVWLADQLASACQGNQLHLARACYGWVVAHVAKPKPEDTWSVHESLFGRKRVAVEMLLLDQLTGTWAERVAWLFMQLCRACELEAVSIPGYWKHVGLRPGERVNCHNHCWNGVKVNGRWRLLDCTTAVLQGLTSPFFIPPEAFLYSYLPLEAHWQLLSEPLSLERWWDLPHANTQFFARGCRLEDQDIGAVNELLAVTQGQVLPSICVEVSVPDESSLTLSHELLDADMCPVAHWPPPPRDSHGHEGGDEWRPQLLFAQVVNGPEGVSSSQFGPAHYTCRKWQLWISIPAPGEWYVRVTLVRELRGCMKLLVSGLPRPLMLNLKEQQDALMFKLVMPPIIPWDDPEWTLADVGLSTAPLPYSLPTFTRQACQLLQPPPQEGLEADRETTFKVCAPGVSRLQLRSPEGEVVGELTAQKEEQDPPHMFTGTFQVPRAPGVQLVGLIGGGGEAGSRPSSSASSSSPSPSPSSWVPLVRYTITPQVQHVVYVDSPELREDLDPADPQLFVAEEMFRSLDENGDGQVSRKEMLVAFRHNRQLADILKFPPRIYGGGDDTFERFNNLFQQIDKSRLGSFDLWQLAVYMGVRPKPPPAIIPVSSSSHVASTRSSTTTSPVSSAGKVRWG